MQQTRASDQQPTRMDLIREALMGDGANAGPGPYPTNVTTATHPYPQTDSPSHNHNIDPNVTGEEPLPYAMETEDNSSPDARKGKRELSTSKRAAQNRAAQRAFRQRKEGYIRKLEDQVKDFQSMEQNFKALQTENYQLREYILNLQARLLENQADFPPPPSHINLSASAGPSDAGAGAGQDAEQQLRREMQQQHHPPAPVMASREDPALLRHDGLSQLQAAAGVAEAARSPYPSANEYPPPPPRDGQDDVKFAK